MAEKICPTHELVLDFVPEGVARKSGKRYNAFYSCPNRDCKYSENIEEKKGHFMSMKAEMRRAKEIAFMNSNNAAVTLVTSEGYTPRPSGDKEYGEAIKFWRDWFRKEWETFYLREVIEESDE